MPSSSPEPQLDTWWAEGDSPAHLCVGWCQTGKTTACFPKHRSKCLCPASSLTPKLLKREGLGFLMDAPPSYLRSPRGCQCDAHTLAGQQSHIIGGPQLRGRRPCPRWESSAAFRGPGPGEGAENIFIFNYRSNTQFLVQTMKKHTK